MIQEGIESIYPYGVSYRAFCSLEREGEREKEMVVAVVVVVVVSNEQSNVVASTGCSASLDKECGNDHLLPHRDDASDQQLD
jgi:hypothetical protein